MMDFREMPALTQSMLQQLFGYYSEADCAKNIKKEFLSPHIIIYFGFNHRAPIQPHYPRLTSAARHLE